MLITVAGAVTAGGADQEALGNLLHRWRNERIGRWQLGRLADEQTGGTG
jgi:uncharacterized protein YjiS (DUF1127 family)